MGYEIEKHDADVWFIAYNQDEGIHHFGLLEVGRCLATGQPVLEQFATEGEMEQRLDELKEENGWYASHKKEQEGKLTE